MSTIETPAPGRVTAWLLRSNRFTFSLYAILAAFGTYFCMYAFRKPFGAAQYEGLHFFGTVIDLKISLTISQVIGYASAKYLGLKFC